MIALAFSRPTVAALIVKRALPFAVLVGVSLCTMQARAQAPGCTVTAFTDPPRDVLTCTDGLTINAERGSDYKLLDRNRDGKLDAAQLTSRGLLIELPPKRRGGFQILTPHAIASMRGTVWAVDVTSSRTSVFVREGVVDVRRRDSAVDAVRLSPGDGVDVEPRSGQPLRATRWSPERAAHLLARFGR